MALDKLKGIFGNQDSDDDYAETEEYVTPTGKAGNTMILLEPRAYSESQQIADYLKNGSSVVVNLKRVTATQAKRIMDFLSGTIYAIKGNIQKIGSGIFLCTPNNINVQGKITDETDKEKDKDKDEDNINYEW